MFKIYKRPFGRHTEYVITNSSTRESASIVDLGANTRELVLRAKGSDSPPFSVMLGYETPEGLEEGRWARGIKMIPFPNRILDGRYCFGGKEHQLPINFPSQGHAIHGLLSKQTMDPHSSEEGRREGSVTLEYDFSGKFEGYPFGLHVQVRNGLTEEGFEVQTLAENTGNGPLPFGDGWHPYFRFNGRSDVDSWQLGIPAKFRVNMSDRLIPTGGLSPVKGTEFDFLKRRRIGALSPDNVFTGLRTRKGRTVTELSNDELGASIEVWQDSVYRYLVIFTPPGENRNCVAIEPMTCNTNAFNNKEGLIVLEPGEKFQGSYGVKVT